MCNGQQARTQQSELIQTVERMLAVLGHRSVDFAGSFKQVKMNRDIHFLGQFAHSLSNAESLTV